MSFGISQIIGESYPPHFLCRKSIRPHLQGAELKISAGKIKQNTVYRILNWTIWKIPTLFKISIPWDEIICPILSHRSLQGQMLRIPTIEIWRGYLLITGVLWGQELSYRCIYTADCSYALPSKPEHIYVLGQLERTAFVCTLTHQSLFNQGEGGSTCRGWYEEMNMAGICL